MCVYVCVYVYIYSRYRVFIVVYNPTNNGYRHPTMVKGSHIWGVTDWHLAESSKEFKKKLQEKGVDVSPWLAVMAKAHGLAKIFEKWSMMVRWQHIIFYHESHCKITFPSFIFDVLCSHPCSKQFPSCRQVNPPIPQYSHHPETLVEYWIGLVRNSKLLRGWFFWRMDFDIGPSRRQLRSFGRSATGSRPTVGQIDGCVSENGAHW